MGLGNNPYSTSVTGDDEGKWGDFGGIREIDGPIRITPKQIHDAQQSVVELVNYGKGESMKFLEILGIDRKVNQDDNDCKDS